jgi:hypothetical protein
VLPQENREGVENKWPVLQNSNLFKVLKDFTLPSKISYNLKKIKTIFSATVQAAASFS